MSSSARTALHQVPPARVAECWPVIEPMITAAMDRDGTYTAENVREWLVKELMQLWIAGTKERGVEALAVTEILQHQKCRVLNILICTGKDRDRWLAHLGAIETWARTDKGCDRALLYARKGWARHLPDYKLTHVLLEKRL